MTATMTVTQMRTSLTTAISVAERSPLTYVITASSTNAVQSDACTGSPICAMQISMPYTWSAMYGMVATMPVSVIAAASGLLPKRSRTKSDGRDVAARARERARASAR